jgi:hypothetical protein
MRIAYVNTWGGFNHEFATKDFTITKMLREIDPSCEIALGFDPSIKTDLVISIYRPMQGNPHYADMSKIDCKKIAFTGESYDIVAVTPGCDAYIGFDPEDEMPKDVMSLRYPLYALYHQDYLDRHGCSSFEELRERFRRQKQAKISAVVSNPSNGLRTSLIEYLVRTGVCASGGRVHNNIGEVNDKLEFTADYAMALTFENLSKKSYITEKIYEAFLVNAVPIYWGAIDIHEEFNPQAYTIFDASSNDAANNSLQGILSMLSDPDFLHTMSEVDPITGFRSENYIRNGRDIFKNFIMSVLETK